MIEITDKRKCSGCTACVNVCPKKAIMMQKDSEGFLYPHVDKEKCVNCKLCEKICPVLSKRTKEMNEFPKSFLGFEKNKESRINSTSGGVFFSIAKAFLEQKNGVVIGAAYDDNFIVKHIMVERIEDLKKLQKSKYVQSYLGDIFKDIENKLKQNIPVLFSGTSCQVAGLKRFIPIKLQEELYCIDLSCKGVPSPKVFQKYIEYQRKMNGEINEIITRDKKIYKRSYRTGYGIKFKNGCYYFGTHDKDPMARIFFANLCNRPICYECPFKTIGRISDLTLGDCFFAHHFIKDFEDRYGVTLTIIQSEKGKELLDLATSLELYKVDTEEAIKINGGMIFESTTEPKKRKDFFQELDNINDFKELADSFKKTSNDSTLDRIKTVLVDKGLIPKKMIYKKKQKEIDKRLSKIIPENSKKIYY